MTEIQEDKTENKPSEKVEKEEEKMKWGFNTKPLTIREMIALKIPPKEVFEMEGISLPIKWTSLIRLVNHKMISGTKIDLDTNMMDGLKAYSECMTKSFL